MQWNYFFTRAKQELIEETKRSDQLIDLLQQDESIYSFERLDINSNLKRLVNEKNQQKAGYLNLRSYCLFYFNFPWNKSNLIISKLLIKRKFPFISKWDRAYYFIQNGCLMHQQKNEIAGSMFMELKSDFSVSSCEIDERAYVFQIVQTFPSKRFLIRNNLQLSLIL